MVGDSYPYHMPWAAIRYSGCATFSNGITHIFSVNWYFLSPR
jgi:hypothetical protein